MGKIIVIEGTDCSGKETQAKLLVDRLKKENRKIEKMSFPSYDSPTGKIVGGPYLGKKHLGEGVFPEGAANVDAKVSSLYFAADRKYNIGSINELLNSGYDVLLDRYVESNMAHQGGKLKSKEERLKMYKWLDTLEYMLLELPRPDLTIFLYMPYEYALKLREERNEPADEHEKSVEHLKNAEISYLELERLYQFQRIDCVKNKKIKTKEEIHEEVYSLVKKIV